MASVEEQSDDIENEENEKSNNQNENDDKSGIVKKLSDFGLDGKKWAGIVEKRLGITRAEQTEHLTIEDLLKLSGDTRYHWEENALRKCFDISENDYQTSKDDRQNKTKEEAMQLLKDVNTLREKGEDHTNALIKEKIDRVRSILNVTDDQWIKPSDNKNLDTMIDQLTSEVEKMDTLSEGRSTLTASELLEKASGGLALRGILLGYGSNAIPKRTVLRTPTDVILTSPSMLLDEGEEDFSSKKQFDHFTQSLDTMGHNYTAAAKVGIWGVSAEAGFGKKDEKEDEKKHEDHEQTLFECKMKYSFIPTAACELKQNSLHLSKEALEELKYIDNILELIRDTDYADVVNHKCTEFLKTYGSHINVGVLHFGGINRFTATYNSKTKSKTATTKSMLSDALSAYVSASYSSPAFNVGGSVGYEQMKNHVQIGGEHDEKELTKMNFKTTRNGGPPEQSSYQLWKRGLVQYSSTWSLIDRGNDFVEIWKVVSDHKRDYFKEPDRLKLSLKTAWELMTGYKESIKEKETREKEESLDKAIYEMNQMTQMIYEMNSGPIESKACIKNLRFLSETMELVEGTNIFWEKELCENEQLSSFLRKIVEHSSQFESDATSEIQLLMRKLIKHVKFKKFLGEQMIINWAEGELRDEVSYTLTNAGVKNIPDLIKYMKGKFIAELEAEHYRNEKKDVLTRDKINRKATTDMTLCVNNLITHLQKSKELKQLFFLKVTLLSEDYHLSMKQFKMVFEIDKIRCFIEKIEALWGEYLLHREKGEIQHQAFLIHMLLTSGFVDGQQSTEEKFTEITKDFKPVLLKEVMEVLDTYATDSPFHWDEMTSITGELVKGNMTVVEEKQLEICDLKEVFTPNENVHHEEQCKSNKHDSNASVDLVVAEDAFSDMLETLGLNEYYPSKISLSSILALKKINDYTGLVDLPWMIIHRLIMNDYRARDQLFALVNELESGNVNSLDTFLETPHRGDEVNPSDLHPLDVLITIFTCCDNILKQKLAQKMLVCKLAIPFIYPQGTRDKVMMSLWALRTITLYCHSNFETITKIPVTTNPLPLITFVRLGRPPISKSKLINNILRDESHDTFFNHDCNNGTVTRRLADGLVECSWFITTDKKEEPLPKTAMFLNLRGDASSMGKQMQVLQEISSVVFVIVTAQDLANPPNTNTCQRILNSDAKVVLLIGANNNDEKQKCIQAVGMDLIKHKQTYIAEFTNAQRDIQTGSELTKIARKLLSKIIDDGCACKDIEESAKLAKTHGVVIDECDNFICHEGKTHAENVLSYKDLALQLQVVGYIEYYKCLKRQHRECQNAYQIKQMKQQMARHRKEQLEICQNGLTPFIRQFMSNLLKKPDDVLYFLNWMAIFLDGTSREILSNRLKSEMDFEERPPSSASLNLEDLFRELGQIYETITESNIIGDDTKTAVEHLPNIAAKLLIKGSSLELLHGDTSSVPITWVHAVLRELKNIIGEKRLFVVSVLGQQSSGIFTLLDTMFGHQFSVGCERGAYMKLLPADEKALLPFDYIVVIYTGGLMGTELEQLQSDHDNELATFVIGLADVTIVNIKGDNISGIKDVLQVAVHAFLRMNLVSKQSKNNKTCIFVHQKVPAINSNEMLKYEPQTMLETLNNMTEEAANIENIADVYSFSQIINFDVKKHVWHFSELWQGNPPMAPANPSYSEKVRSLRLNIIAEIAQQQTAFLTTSSLPMRITDVWKRILADGFVFSFRNSFEIKSFYDLQTEYNDLESTFESHLQCWLRDAESGLETHDTVEELEHHYYELITELPDILNEGAANVRTGIDEYFEKINIQEDIVQAQSANIKRIDVDKLQSEIMKTLLSVKESRRFEMLQVGKWSSLEERIAWEATDLTYRLEDKEITDAELEEEFDIIWVKMVNKLELATHCEDKDQKMHFLIEDILHERYKHQRHILLDELKRHPLNTPFEQESLEGSITVDDVRDNDISLKVRQKEKFVRVFGYQPVLHAKKRTETLTGNILQDISTYLRKLDNKFNTSYATDVINKINETITSFNDDDTNFFKLHPTYAVKLAVHVGHYCVKIFDKMRSDYIKEHDVNAKLDMYKKTAWSMFKNIYEQKTEAAIYSSTYHIHICRVVLKFIEKKAINTIPAKVVDDLLLDVGNTKEYMINKILKDLARRDDFDNYQWYLNDPKSYASGWINQYLFTVNKQHESSRYVERCKFHIHKIIERFIKHIEHAFQQVEGMTAVEKTNHWLETLSEEIDEVFADEIGKYRQVQNPKLLDFRYLKTSIFDTLDEVQENLIKKFAAVTEDTVKWFGRPPSEILMNKLWGCEARCPFCKEPCVISTPEHYGKEANRNHRCVNHIPHGIRGTIIHDDEGLRFSTKTCNYLVHDKKETFTCKSCSYECRNHGCIATDGDFKHKYHEYRKYFGEWNIYPESSMTVSKYWMWFAHKYNHNLTHWHYAVGVTNYSFPIPDSWKSITMEEALASLHDKAAS